MFTKKKPKNQDPREVLNEIIINAPLGTLKRMNDVFGFSMNRVLHMRTKGKEKEIIDRMILAAKQCAKDVRQEVSDQNTSAQRIVRHYLKGLKDEDVEKHKKWLKDEEDRIKEEKEQLEINQLH